MKPIRLFRAGEGGPQILSADDMNEIVKTLNNALHEILADADVKKRLLELGIGAKASTPAEIRTRLKSDIDKWQKVIENAGIQKQ